MSTELHLHFSGCVRPVDLLRHLAGSERPDWEWYETQMRAAYGVVPPTREVVERYRRGDQLAAAEFEELFVFGEQDAGDFARFQAKANLLWIASWEGDPTAGPAKAAAELGPYAAGIRDDFVRQGVTYAELRISATMLPFVYDGDEDEALVRRFAISLNRSDPWAGWEEVKTLALGPDGRVVVGIDFSGFEEGHPPKAKAEFFAAVHAFNATHPDRALAILYHVGESYRDKSLESAVRWVHEAADLGVHRLGHAIALGVDPDLHGPHTREESVAERRDQLTYDVRHQDGLRTAGVPIDLAANRAEERRLAASPPTDSVRHEYDAARLAEVRRRQDYAMEHVRAAGAVIEVCPTSNRRIGGITDPAHHPVHRFLASGIPIVVSSDDPGIFGTTLADEINWVIDHTGGGDALREQLAKTAWESRSEVLSGRC